MTEVLNAPGIMLRALWHEVTYPDDDLGAGAPGTIPWHAPRQRRGRAG